MLFMQQHATTCNKRIAIIVPPRVTCTSIIISSVPWAMELARILQRARIAWIFSTLRIRTAMGTSHLIVLQSRYICAYCNKLHRIELHRIAISLELKYGLSFCHGCSHWVILFWSKCSIPKEMNIVIYSIKDNPKGGTEARRGSKIKTKQLMSNFITLSLIPRRESRLTSRPKRGVRGSKIVQIG
jgi:hypothetical protein